MINQGWVKIHRRILDNPICTKPEYAWLWTFLLLSANHQEKSFIWNDQSIKIKEGQLLTGRKELSKKTGVSQSKVYRILKYLENEQQIKQQKTTRFTIITIVNWDKYQQSEQHFEQQVNNKRTTSEQQVNTNKNEKNEKNEKKIILHGEEQSSFTQFLERFNSIRKEYLPNSKGIGVTDDKAKRQFLALTKKGVTLEDFETATRNMFEDEHHHKNHWKWSTPEFITRSDKFTRFLNTERVETPSVYRGMGSSLAIS